MLNLLTTDAGGGAAKIKNGKCQVVSNEDMVPL